MNAGQRRKFNRASPQVGDVVSFYFVAARRVEGTVISSRYAERASRIVQSAGQTWLVPVSRITILKRFVP